MASDLPQSSFLAMRSTAAREDASSLTVTRIGFTRVGGLPNSIYMSYKMWGFPATFSCHLR
jgi:hypothetical protein